MKQRRANRAIIIILVLIILIVLALFSIALFWELSPFRNISGNDGLQTEIPEASAPAGVSHLPSSSASSDAPMNTDLSNGVSPNAVISGGQTEAYVPPVYPEAPSRVTYSEGFYYEPVSEQPELMERIRNLSYKESINVQMPFENLSYIRVRYVNFQNMECDGELICNKAIASDLVAIFAKLYEARYQIESIRLIDDFNADDVASMRANNTSAFNYRFATGSDTELSEHSFGLSVDLNPLYNPYIALKASTGEQIIEPAEGLPYTDRTQDFPHKIDENDLAYKLFTEHGFSWGGHWSSPKDYQHFEKKLAD